MQRRDVMSSPGPGREDAFERVDDLPAQRHAWKRPNLFLVGAPRCGTTSLTRWLSAHPDVYLPEIKVPFHFGRDLDMVPKRQFRDLDAYLALFADSAAQRWRGESTPFYLYSACAASEIHAFESAARIIIMLRNPVDLMYSMHARNLMDGNEVILDFAAALDAEAERKNGRRLPRYCFFRQGLYYRDLARLAKQVSRYLALFDRKQVHIIIFDDLKRAPEECFRQLSLFLGLDPAVGSKLGHANKSTGIRSPTLAGFLHDPPKPLMRLPTPLRDSIIWRLNRWNRGGAPRRSLGPDLRQQLLGEYAAEVGELGELLRRDLSFWLK